MIISWGAIVQRKKCVILCIWGDFIIIIIVFCRFIWYWKNKILVHMVRSFLKMSVQLLSLSVKTLNGKNEWGQDKRDYWRWNFFSAWSLSSLLGLHKRKKWMELDWKQFISFVFSLSFSRLLMIFYLSLFSPLLFFE